MYQLLYGEELQHTGHVLLYGSPHHLAFNHPLFLTTPKKNPYSYPGSDIITSWTHAFEYCEHNFFNSTWVIFMPHWGEIRRHMVVVVCVFVCVHVCVCVCVLLE